MFVKMLFGAHLYELQTESSDKDYKGIFLPERRDLILNRVPKTFHESTGSDTEKNQAGDMDFEAFSIYEFVRLAMNGETVALDMLHAKDKHVVDWDDNYEVFRDLRANRQKFYCTDMKAYMGYVRRQAAKYGVKGGRLAAAREVLEILNNFRHHCDLENPDKPMRVKHIGHFPTNEYCEWIEEKDRRGEVRNFYQVCGRKLQDTLPLDEAYGVVKKVVDSYGHRVKQAENNENIDFKAVSHALRAGFQLRSIYKYGDFEYPLEESDFIYWVKTGQLDFKTVVQPELEGLVDEVEQLSDKSNLPSKPDKKFWDNWLEEVIESTVIGDK